MSGRDEHDPYGQPPYQSRRYQPIQTDNSTNGANKIVWWVASVLGLLYFTTMTGAQVWMLNMLIDLQREQSANDAIDLGQNRVIEMMLEAQRNLQQRQQ